jgi:hypothetical protein
LKTQATPNPKQKNQELNLQSQQQNQQLSLQLKRNKTSMKLFILSLAVVLSNSFFSHADEIRINMGFASSKFHSDLYKSKIGLGAMTGFTLCKEDVYDFKNFNLLTELNFQFLNTRTVGYREEKLMIIVIPTPK